MLTVRIPKNYQEERNYIILVLLGEFLGLDYNIEISEISEICITAGDEKILIISDGLFNTETHHWLKSCSLPRQPLQIWDLGTTSLKPRLVNEHVPVIYGDDVFNPKFFTESDSRIYLGLDVFGSAFFMLTRYEELAKQERDIHNRFPAKASLAYQEGFLDRPIINEYIEILWWCLKYLWPSLKRKPRKFQIHLSHDVDQPYKYAFKPPISSIRSLGGDLLKRKNPQMAIQNFTNWISVKSGNIQSDPFNTFDKIMDFSEQRGLISAFYFIPNNHLKIDGRYQLEHPYIRSLLKHIYDRGHEIGYHGSYISYNNLIQHQTEFKKLKNLCDELGIYQDIWGGRQHYLRWAPDQTWKDLEQIGLNYDTTLGFADYIGFRCGICYEFSTFDILSKQKLKIKERPLIIMDATFDERYMGLSCQTALDEIYKLRERCKMFNGQFSMLWHNNTFAEKEKFLLMENSLAGVI
jgi:hypothetical protein